MTTKSYFHRGEVGGGGGGEGEGKKRRSEMQNTRNREHDTREGGMQDIFTLPVSCHESQRDVMSAW